MAATPGTNGVDDLGWMVEFIRKGKYRKPRFRFCDTEEDAVEFAHQMEAVGWIVNLWAM